jgi:hypothetical protein
MLCEPSVDGVAICAAIARFRYVASTQVNLSVALSAVIRGATWPNTCSMSVIEMVGLYSKVATPVVAPTSVPPVGTPAVCVISVKSAGFVTPL